MRSTHFTSSPAFVMEYLCDSLSYRTCRGPPKAPFCVYFPPAKVLREPCPTELVPFAMLTLLSFSSPGCLVSYHVKLDISTRHSSLCLQLDILGLQCQHLYPYRCITHMPTSVAKRESQAILVTIC